MPSKGKTRFVLHEEVIRVTVTPMAGLPPPLGCNGCASPGVLRRADGKRIAL